MLKFIIATLCFLGGSCFADSQTALVPGNARVLSSVSNILENVRFSQYSHKTIIDVKTGKYFCDCSGLGVLLLKPVTPESIASLPIEKGFIRARAISFYNAFTNAVSSSSQSGWQLVPTVADAEPGDFIAWRRNTIEKGKSSGHVMILLEKPVRESDGSYRAKVIDSSSTPHTNDSRSEQQTGIGTGTMWFEADETGRPVGFRWSSRQKKSTPVPIAIGRVMIKDRGTGSQPR